MIHLALLILAACIVIPFFLIVTAGGMLLVARFWYVFAVLFIIGWYWIDRINSQNAETFKKASINNSYLQQHCQDDAKTRYRQLAYTQPPAGYTNQRYQSELSSAYLKVSNQCALKYPVYSTN